MRCILSLCAAAMASACVTPGRPFDNSSADFNRGEAHQFVTAGDPEAVSDAVISIMEQQGASLVKRRNSGSTIVLSFRVSIERVRGSTTIASGAYSPPRRWFRVGAFSGSAQTMLDYVAYGALFYVEVAQDGAGVVLRAIGLPVIDGLTACAPAAAPWRECRPSAATSRGDSFAEFASRRSGLDLSGRKEAELITGLFAHLQRKRWQDVFKRDSARPEAPEIDDAFSDER